MCAVDSAANLIDDLQQTFCVAMVLVLGSSFVPCETLSAITASADDGLAPHFLSPFMELFIA
eukprot:m.1031461 g.1031461  ORF g.1031461 m.1031461 type:complete len:62 (+) comp24122_c0_seq11:2546-2731(+)